MSAKKEKEVVEQTQTTNENPVAAVLPVQLLSAIQQYLSEQKFSEVAQIMSAFQSVQLLQQKHLDALEGME